MITMSLKCSAIDKSKLYKGKTGEMYLNITLLETPNNQWGNDYVCIQSTTKAEREAGIKGAILGNAKLMEKPATQSAGPPTSTAPRQSDQPARATPPLREDGEYPDAASLPF